MYDEDETVSVSGDGSRPVGRPGVTRTVSLLCADPPDGARPAPGVPVHRPARRRPVRLRGPQPGQRGRAAVLPRVPGSTCQSGEPSSNLVTLHECATKNQKGRLHI